MTPTPIIMAAIAADGVLTPNELRAIAHAATMAYEARSVCADCGDVTYGDNFHIADCCGAAQMDVAA